MSKYKVFTLQNYKSIPQLENVSEEQLFNIKVVGSVLPFKTNNYVVDELIDWNNVPNDPIYILNFPQQDMLRPEHFDEMANAITTNKDVKEIANKIRLSLNPHPAGQMEHNIPMLDGQRLVGMQHKYKETVLFFPSQGQTCHAYCTFCFRWPQFVGMADLKFAMKESDLLVRYVKEHEEIRDVLFTGGDPMVMRTKVFEVYVNALLDANISHLQTIRIGTKSLAYWPYRFTTDSDADNMLGLFRRVVEKGKHLAIMAHFNHTVELLTDAVKEAIIKIRETGAQIRTQSPLLANINDDSKVWMEMWTEQIRQGCIPYYFFIARDTGAQHYFKVRLDRALEIYHGAYKKVSGLGRTVRGPSMSGKAGKIVILGITEINNEKFFVLSFTQGRNPDWVGKPFFAKYNPDAVWIDELEPAFSDKFFFED